jgi:hypothetical protein
MASNIVAVTAPDYGIPTPAITYSTDGGNTWLFPNKADFPTTLFGGFESTSWLGGAGRGVAYGYDNSTPTNKSCFVAVGSGPGVIGYSTNGGSVWKVATTPADLFQATSGGGGGGYAIAYGKDKNNNNCFVAVGGYDFAKSITGGESWIKQTPTNSNYIYGNLYGVAYGNGTFVAVGGGNVSAIPPGVFPAAISYSTDGGVTWTPVISTTLFSYGTAEGAEGVISSGNGVAYGYDNNNVGCFVAVGDYFNNGNINGQIGYSSDGITWSISSLVDTRTKSTLFNGSGDSVQCVAYDSSNKRFVAGGSVFTGRRKNMANIYR